MRRFCFVICIVFSVLAAPFAQGQSPADPPDIETAWYEASDYLDYSDRRYDVSREAFLALRANLEAAAAAAPAKSKPAPNWQILESMGRLGLLGGEAGIAVRDFSAAIADAAPGRTSDEMRRLQGRLGLALLLDGRFSEAEAQFSRIELCEAGAQCDLRSAYAGCAPYRPFSSTLMFEADLSYGIPVGVCASRQLLQASQDAAEQSRFDLIEPLLRAAVYLARPTPLGDEEEAASARLEAGEALVEFLIEQRRLTEARMALQSFSVDADVKDLAPERLRKLSAAVSSAASSPARSRYAPPASRNAALASLEAAERDFFEIGSQIGAPDFTTAPFFAELLAELARLNAALGELPEALDYSFSAILHVLMYTEPGLPLRADMGPPAPDCPPGAKNEPHCRAWFDDVVAMYSSEDLAAKLSEYAVYLAKSGEVSDALGTEDRARTIQHNWFSRNWNAANALSVLLRRRADLDAERLSSLRQIYSKGGAFGARALRHGFEIIQNVQFSSVEAALRQSVARRSFLDNATRMLLQERQVLTFESGRLGQQDLARAEDIRRRIAALDAKLPVPFSEIEQKSGYRPLLLEDAVKALEENEALVVIAAQPQTTEVMVITRAGSLWYAPAMSSQELAGRVALLRAHVDAGNSFDFAAAHDLYRELLLPAKSLIGEKRIIASVSGPLSALPLSILITKPATGRTYEDRLRNAEWVALRNALLYVPSVSGLKELARRSAGARRLGFVGFGDPVPVSEILADAEHRNEQSLGRLPYAATEIERLAAVTNAPQSQIFLGNRATKRALTELDLSSVSILAFATHAVKSAGSMRLEPGLMMTRPPGASGSDDVYLTASEVASLPLGVDVVILSACSTAGDDGSGGEALTGLTQAFFFAGARSVIATHWAIQDIAAAELVPSILDPGAEILPARLADQLRRAIGQHISEAKTLETIEPRYWGAFVVVGG